MRAVVVLRSHGPTEVLRRAAIVLGRTPNHRAYHRWAQKQDLDVAQKRPIMEREQAEFAHRPLISFVMPVYNTQEVWLRQVIESIRAQIYPNWELCIADDASPGEHVRKILDHYARVDPRIKVACRESNGHISAATNTALQLAQGEFVCLVDHDDVVAEHALYELVKKYNEDPALDMIYSDEDKITVEGQRFDPAFKPDWSPEYLESCMYTAHLAMYRKRIVDEIGGFRSVCDGAQDYDFVLRFTEKTNRIAHVPAVLYHWRAIPGSTAMAMSDKSYVLPAGVKALEGRLERTGRAGTVCPSAYPGCFDIRVRLRAHPLVSIVIPTAGRDRKVRKQTINLVKHCVEKIRAHSTYSNYEIVIVDNGDLAAPVRQALSQHGCRFISYTEPEFNISRKLNLGASAAKGEYLLLLNDDIEVIRGDWIEALLEQAIKPGVGVVGAKLLYENDRLQHAGVVHRMGLPDHVRKHHSRYDVGYMFSTVSVRNFLAVTGACMLTPAALFREVGGFDEAFKVNYSDIDYCMKLRRLGYRAVYTPHAELYHFESASRPATVAQEEIDLYLQRWGAETQPDPYYNTRYLRGVPPDFGLQLPE